MDRERGLVLIKRFEDWLDKGEAEIRYLRKELKLIKEELKEE